MALGEGGPAEKRLPEGCSAGISFDEGGPAEISLGEGSSVVIALAEGGDTLCKPILVRFALCKSKAGRLTLAKRDFV